MTEVVRRGAFAGASVDDLRELIELTDDPRDLDAIVRAIEDELLWRPFPYQRAPDLPWWLWLFMGGRFTGKTDTDAHWLDEHATGPPCDRRVPGGHRMSIVAPTLGDAVESCVNGPSGLKAHNPEVRLVTRPGGTFVVWPNGSEAVLFGGWTAADVERFRAKGNRCACWIEEAAAIPQAEAIIDQVPFSHRLGAHPRVVVSTTPKPRALLRNLMRKAREWRDHEHAADYNLLDRVVVTRASSSWNPTVPRELVEGLYAEYGSSRLGRQELEGELLEDFEGALWNRDALELDRIEAAELPVLVRRTLGIDPSTWGLKAEELAKVAEDDIGRGIETGMVVNGIATDRQTYTLADYSKRATPAEWAELAIDAVVRWTCTDITFETNAGGAMGPAIIMATDKARRLEHPEEVRPPLRFYREKPTRIGVIAADGKRARAEPVAAMAEAHRHHMVGTHPYLEDQLCGWDPNENWSPDRLDGHVWGVTRLRPWRAFAPTSMGDRPRGTVTL